MSKVWCSYCVKREHIQEPIRAVIILQRIASQSKRDQPEDNKNRIEVHAVELRCHRMKEKVAPGCRYKRNRVDMYNMSIASMTKEGNEDNRKRHYEGGGCISSIRSRSSTHDEAHDECSSGG